MTVDSHIHLLPERLGVAVRRFFADRLGYQSWAYPVDHDVVCARLAVEGVEEAWNLPYAHKPGIADELNAATAAISAAQADGPVRVVAGATVHPGDDDPLVIVRRAVEDLGARVLKLHCSVGDYDPDDPRLDPVWAYTASIALPTVVHAGHAISGHTGADELVPIATVARRWPQTRIIIAHCGHRAATTALDLVYRHRELYADLTPVVSEPVLAPPEKVATVGDKVLFGSDAPNSFLTVTESLAWVDAMGLEPDVLTAVTGGNARRLQAEIRS
ncbi:MAG: amidohydrolase family protein [Actinomycetota bacterium]|nr:amidohydrolase family protein [Actinomycetota bacterium]